MLSRTKEFHLVLVLVICLYLLFINLLLFVSMKTDKQKARSGKWRIPESVLLGTAIAGGSIGGILGMKKFHHKTKKPLFYLGFPLCFIIDLIFLFLIFRAIM